MSRWRVGLGLVCALVVAGLGCQTVPAGPQGAAGQGGVSDVRRSLGLPVAGTGGSQLAWWQLRGQVVLVNFFATWCFPCLVELPTLESLQREYGARGFQVVAVGMDLEGERVLGPFAEHYRLPYPVLVADEQLRGGQSAFGPVAALPTSFLLSREGQVAAAWQGTVSAEALQEAIERLLER